MQKLFKRSLAVVLAVMMVATLFVGAITASAFELIDAQFSAMDAGSTVNWPSGDVAVAGLEGDGAKQTTVIGNEVMLYTYNDTRTDPPLDITYATHITFDFWVEDGAAFSAAVQGAADCGVNMDDADNESKWGQTGGFVTAADLKAAMANLQDGWNHIVAPLQAESECWNLASIRIYFAGADALNGMTLAVDDIRFVEEAALEEIIAKRNVAKDVTIAIRNLPELDFLSLDDKAAVDAAATAYATVETDYFDLVQDADKLEAIIDKMTAMEAAAQDPANKEAADAVVALIAALPAEITLDVKADVEAARAAYDALTDAQKVLVSNYGALLAAEKQIIYLTPMDFQFAALNGDASYAVTEGTTGEIIFDNFLEGDGALKITANGNKQNFFAHIYRVKHDENPGYEIVGGEYLTFDLYLSNARAITKNTIGAGDATVNMCSNDYWDGKDYGSVARADVQSMFRNLKTGWNHVVLPIDRSAATGDILWAFRLYHTNIKVATGEYFIMDDVRIMNEIATLTVLPERTKAKDATLAIREIPALDVITADDQIYVDIAREAYAAVANEYKGVVVNAAYIDEAQAAIDALNGPSDEDVANEVIAQIAALNVQSLDDEAAVVAAREAFTALTDEQKALVSNLDALRAAEAAIAELKAAAEQEAADKAAAATVEAQIAALNVQTLDDKAAVEAAREAFTALTDAQKAYVTNVAALEAAEAAIAELQAAADKAAADKAAADAVIAEIAALNVQTLDDKAAVEAAREAYTALTDDQKALVDNVAALEAAEAAIAELQAAADKEAADKAAAAAVDAQIAALNVQSLNDEAAVVAAREAYTALTDDQKAYVANLAALEAAEAAIEALKVPAAPIEGPIDGKFYQNGELVPNYQVVCVDGNFYYIYNFNKALTNTTIYMTEALLANTGLEAGYYTFDANGVMTAANGIQEGMYFVDGERACLYEIIEVDGDFYFVSDYYKLAKDCKIFLGKAIVADMGWKAGFYTFDVDGKIVF